MFGCESDAAARASRSNRCALGARREHLHGDARARAPRRRRARRSSSHPRPSGSISRYRPAISSSAIAADYRARRWTRLPTIDEALALVLEHVASARRRGRGRRRRGGARARRRRARARRPAAVRQLGDGRLRRARRRHARDARVVGRLGGRPARRPRRSAPGEAIAISTGAVVPGRRRRRRARSSAPTAAATPSTVEARRPGENVRPRGGDAARRRRRRRAGTRARPGAARRARGAPASRSSRAAAVRGSPCSRRGPSCGAPGEPLGPGEIYESNTRDARGAARGARARSRSCSPPVADDEAATRAALERGLEADVLLTSGGVSVGEHDLVRGAARRARRRRRSSGASRCKPGKPVAFATRGDDARLRPARATRSRRSSGSSSSSGPALLALQGARDPAPALLPGRLGAAAPRGTRAATSSSARALERGGRPRSRSPGRSRT